MPLSPLKSTTKHNFIGIIAAILEKWLWIIRFGMKLFKSTRALTTPFIFLSGSKSFCHLELLSQILCSYVPEFLNCRVIAVHFSGCHMLSGLGWADLAFAKLPKGMSQNKKSNFELLKMHYTSMMRYLYWLILFWAMVA
jgi:hypothetical protein